MPESRRRLLMTLASAFGVLAADPYLFGLQLPRPAREARPYPKGHEQDNQSNAQASDVPQKKVIDLQSQKLIREDVAKLYEMASELKGVVERTDANSTLSLSLINKAQQIEKLAKQIRELAKG